MLINKKSLRYILYTLPVLLLIIFPLIMGCLVYSINLNSQQLDTNKGLIEYVNDYLPFNASFIDNPDFVSPSYEDYYNYVRSNSNNNLWTRDYQFNSYSMGALNLTWNNSKIAQLYIMPLPTIWIVTIDSGSRSFIDFMHYTYSFIENLDFDGLYGFLDSIGIVSPSTVSNRLASLRNAVEGYVASLGTPSPYTIEYNNTPITSILSDVYMNLFNSLVLPTSSNLGLPYYLFNYMFYVLGVFILYILFIFFIYVPKCLICLLDKSIDKLSGGNL